MPGAQLLLGARNPRALAEAVVGHPIAWDEVDDVPGLLEEVLATPYDELFDPKYGSPVYLGLERSAEGGLREARPAFLDERAEPDDRPDVDRFPTLDLDGLERLADLKAIAGSLEDLPVRSIVPARAGGWKIEVGQAPAGRSSDLAQRFSSAVLDRIWAELFVDLPWTPAGGEWKDVGEFFHHTAEYFDPIQWGLADCWLVSAMSSVAWALPYAVSQRTRAIGGADQSFVNLIELVDPANGTTLRYELSDQTVVWAGTDSPMYSYSSESGELWPSIIEKAFANWRRGTSLDHPMMTALNYGDCVHASAAITGRKPHYTGTDGTSATDLVNLVKSHSASYRTFDPMTAWTYGSAADAPDTISYSTSNIVANHCYSVLGWVPGSRLHFPWLSDVADLTDHRHVESVLAKAGSTVAAGSSLRSAVEARRAVDALDRASIAALLRKDYIVLRNPWGNTESSVGELTGVISLKDISFWRYLDLGVSDGVFAVDVDTFKKYFAGIGVAL